MGVAEVRSAVPGASWARRMRRRKGFLVLAPNGRDCGLGKTFRGFNVRRKPKTAGEKLVRLCRERRKMKLDPKASERSEEREAERAIHPSEERATYTKEGKKEKEQTTR